MTALEAGLYIVSTPIGNLGDMTDRARAVLAGADLIACEDTRVSAKLARAYGFSTPMTAYHAHNAAARTEGLVDRVAAGAAVALISDAGTPLVSDPGSILVRAMHARGLPVQVLPGPTACIAALVLSGLPTERFLMAGFLPAKAGARRAELDELAGVPATLVFYEAPHRIAASLADMADRLGDREAALVREITKLHEECRRGTLATLAEGAVADPPRGEIVVVIAPPVAGEAMAMDDDAIDSALSAALGSASLRDAVDAVAGATGVTRRRVYARALALSREDGA